MRSFANETLLRMRGQRSSIFNEYEHRVQKLGSLKRSANPTENE